MSDVLPLDHYPQIVFPPAMCDDGDGHTLPGESVTYRHVTQTRRIPMCIMCGIPVSWRAKTCSANCRKAASRRKEAIRREIERVQDALKNLERYSDQWPDLHWDIMQAIGQAGIAAAGTSRRVAVKI